MTARRGLSWAGLALLAAGSVAAGDLPRLPAEARLVTSRPGGAVAAGPAGDGGVPVMALPGASQVEVWRIDGDLEVAPVIAGLADQVRAAGYAVVLSCAARACGGFDFRYGLPVTPEPEMHVNLGDFAYLSAQTDDRAVGILVSRGQAALHLEITRTGLPPAEVPQADMPDLAPPGAGAPDRAVSDAEGTGGDLAGGDLTGGDATAATLADRLMAQGHVALDDLQFATGSASLVGGPFASITALAAFLAANPAARVTLVGHTDAEGALAANIALSKRRAEAVVAALQSLPGTDPGQVTAEGAGWLAPRAPNRSPEGRQANRRVEAVLTAGP